MANKSKAAAKRGNIYDNIQKITRPSGTVSYRVRVTEDGEMYSQYETSLKKAKALRNSWVG
jgi:phosphoenolpyruvate carboxylase